MFFQRALLAVLLASVSCGIIGTYIVSKRIVFISDGITHASFGGIGLGYFLGKDPVLTAAIAAVLSALGIRLLSTKGKVREDSSIGIFFSMGMAAGIILIYLTPGYASDLSSYLFGNILTVTSSDMSYSVIITGITLAAFILFYREILYSAFDEEYLKIQKINISVINYFMLALIALVIVVNIRVAGIILIISLLTIPQNTAMIFTKDFKKIMLLSILLGFVCSVTGLYVSFSLNIPTGPAIVFSEAVFFLCAKILHIILVFYGKKSYNYVS